MNKKDERVKNIINKKESAHKYFMNTLFGFQPVHWYDRPVYNAEVYCWYKYCYSVRNYCIVALMLDSGLRLNEVVTLRRDKIHIAEGYAIVNGKGNKERFVPLGLNSKRALLRYCSIVPATNIETPLFVKDTLIPINQSTVKQLFRRLKVQADIPRLHPHLLRHSFATRYLENGGDIYSLQLILGHTSLEMVKKYVHLIPSKTVVNFAFLSPLDNALKKWKNPAVTRLVAVGFSFGDPSEIRTPDTLIKSQVLYRLS